MSSLRAPTRLLVVLALTLAWLVPASGVAAAATVVQPTGAYPDDVALVQAAVDLGGTVLLKATNTAGVPTEFNFGPATPGSGHVDLTSDVRIVGESIPAGRTTIQGGHAPLRSFDDIDVEVRDIAFDGPLRFALLLQGPVSAATTIAGNRVTDVVGQFFPGPGRSFAEAIVASGGAVTITDNTVERVHSDLGIGISQFFSAGPVEIARNQVHDIAGIGIESTANSGAVRIVDNVVSPGGAGDFATGIEINGSGSYYVGRNKVTVDHPSGVGFLAWGTEAFGFGPVAAPVVERNEIVVRSDWDAVELIGIVSDAYIGQNRISGRVGDTGFWMSGFFADPDSELSGNVVAGNNIGRLQVDRATAFLDEFTHDNAFIGQTGSIIDFGTDNRYTGMTLRSGPGSQVKNAVAQRNAALRDAHDRPVGVDGE